jgi:cytoskeletal protein CcmA (bactofilin family)
VHTYSNYFIFQDSSTLAEILIDLGNKGVPSILISLRREHNKERCLNMWKPRPEDNKPATMNPNPPAQPVPPLAATPSPVAVPQRETPKAAEPHRGDVGHIGKSVQIRGELTGSEDLYLDGEIEGTIDLRDHTLIIGPNGKIKAGITARDLVVHGKIEGNVTASSKVELRKSSTLIGDIKTQRIVIEDGAFFKGAIDIQEKDTKQEARKPMVAAAAAGSSSSMSSGSSSGVTSYSAAPGPQGSFLDNK